jgi:A/G-specific adenine glycosylase
MPAGSFAQRIVRWQRRHGRHDLPWQCTRDPYRVWLSEIMLQQTQVETVRDYYARFLARFPDVHALAEAPLDDVLALWSGLGYYARARHLHHCAQQVRLRYGGSFPRRAEELQRLPGIGRSTAAAIAALCFGEPVAILDGNVKRVLTRHLGFGADLGRAANVAELWRGAQARVPARHADVYTQGLMDLGATLCTARAPACARCPVAADCVARTEGRPEAYPVKLKRLRRSARTDALLWLVHRGRVRLVQRPPHGIWAGLWSLPEADSPAQWQARLQGWPGRGEVLPAVQHALTHLDWTLQPLRWTLPARLGSARLAALEAALPSGRWFDAADALQLGLPAPVRKLLGG